jgi:hypothetical protein
MSARLAVHASKSGLSAPLSVLQALSPQAGTSGRSGFSTGKQPGQTTFSVKTIGSEVFTKYGRVKATHLDRVTLRSFDDFGGRPKNKFTSVPQGYVRLKVMYLMV